MKSVNSTYIRVDLRSLYRFDRPGIFRHLQNAIKFHLDIFSLKINIPENPYCCLPFWFSMAHILVAPSALAGEFWNTVKKMIRPDWNGHQKLRDRIVPKPRMKYQLSDSSKFQEENSSKNKLNVLIGDWRPKKVHFHQKHWMRLKSSLGPNLI